jgi:hypothetical protein
MQDVNVNDIVTNISDIFLSASKKAFDVRQPKKKGNVAVKNERKPWFNVSRDEQHLYRRKRSHYRRTKSRVDLEFSKPRTEI